MFFDSERYKNFDIPNSFIKGERMESVDFYKYRGTIIDIVILFKLYSLNTFQANGDIIESFYQNVMLPVQTFSMVSWFGLSSKKEKKIE